MDTKWERATPEIDLSMSTIQSMINTYEKKQKVKEFIYLSGGCINHNYRVTLANDHDLLLRVVPNETGYKNEIAISRSILSQEIHIPKLYFIGQYDQYKFLIYQFVEGKSLTDLLNTHNKQKYIGQAARSAAIIHNHKSDDIEGLIDIATGSPPFDTWYDLFLDHEYVKDALGAQRLKSINTILSKNQYILKEIEAKKNLTHSDYRPSNMIVDPDDTLFIVDWQSPMTTHVVTDIGQFFRYDEMFSEKDKLVFVNEYNATANVIISPDDFVCADFRDLVNYLQLLQNCEAKPNMRTDMVSLIDNFIEKYA